MIDDLIKRIAAEVGVDDAAASNALGVLFAFLKKEGDTNIVDSMLEKMPGAGALADAHAGDGGGLLGGGLLGGLASAAGSLLGDKAGGALEALMALQKSGLNADQAKSMMPMVLDYARENVGDDLLKRVLESAPALKGLLR
ncbi:MAG: DUF2780 domain-containing protein [Pseudomonadota bacterium]